MASELRPAAEWCEVYGVEVLDPDGWRHDRTPWDAPITSESFLERAMVSTIRAPLW